MAFGSPVLFMVILGAVASLVLIIASKYLSVETDPRIDVIVNALPGVNCGACGFSSCMAAAEAVALGKSGPGVCLIGGDETVKTLESILGKSAAGGVKKRIAFLCCGKNCEEAGKKLHYNGPSDCFSAMQLCGGEKVCEEGCIGLGSCVPVCPVGAITMKKGLPVIDTVLCTGCGLCVKTCPKKIIALIENTQSEIDRKKCGEYCVTSDVLFRVDAEGCIKCGICAKKCPVDAVTWMKGSPAFINKDRCIECFTCLRSCPPKVIS